MAIFWMTLEDMGNAEIPAAPIMGLIFSFEKRFKNFASRTPPMESKTKAEKSNEHDQKSIACYKYICLHTEGNGDSKEQSDEIGQDVLGSV